MMKVKEFETRGRTLAEASVKAEMERDRLGVATFRSDAYVDAATMEVVVRMYYREKQG